MEGHTRDRPAWGRLASSVWMCTAPPGMGDKTGAPQDTLTAPAKFQAEGPRQAGCRIRRYQMQVGEDGREKTFYRGA